MKIDIDRAIEVLSACGYECDEIESLRQQLAAAIAACNLKNIAIQDALWDETWWRVEAVKALAIQPDDSALKDEWRFK